MKTLKEVVIVEGRYDQIKLQSLVRATVLTTNGFRIFSDPEKRKLIRKLAQERGLVVLTDSDRGGFRIRGYLRGIVPGEQVKHAYIPELFGKEKRKAKPGKDGLLGVEGVPAKTILEALHRAGCTFLGEEDRASAATFTRQQLYEDGLLGREDSAERRRKLAKQLGFPQKMTVPALLQALNAGCSQAEYEQALADLENK